MTSRRLITRPGSKDTAIVPVQTSGLEGAEYAINLLRARCPLTGAKQSFLVRYSPENGHCLGVPACPLCATSGLIHCSKRNAIRSARRPATI